MHQLRLARDLAAVDQHRAAQHDQRQRAAFGQLEAGVPPWFRRTSHTSIGVKVRAGPRCPSNSPAITRTLPAPSGKADRRECRDSSSVW